MKPPIILTERFILKPYKKRDLDRFIEISDDPLVIKFMDDGIYDERATIKLFESIFNLYEKDDSDRWFWIWGVYENDKLVAHFELKETEHTNKNELEIVYMTHPEERKKGLMSEVLELIKAKQADWKRRIIATVDVDNKKSISLLENWGIEKKEKIKDLERGDYYYKFLLKE